MPHDIAITDLAACVVEAARILGVKIMTVESCTAGALATLLADTPSAGDVLLGGFDTPRLLSRLNARQGAAVP